MRLHVVARGEEIEIVLMLREKNHQKKSDFASVKFPCFANYTTPNTEGKCVNIWEISSLFLSFFRVQISLAIFGSSGMAFQGRSDSERSHEVPLRVLMLGHSFVAGFKQFLFEDPTRHGPTLNLSNNEFMMARCNHSPDQI